MAFLGGATSTNPNDNPGFVSFKKGDFISLIVVEVREKVGRVECGMLRIFLYAVAQGW